MRESPTEIIVGAAVLVAAAGFLAYALDMTGFSLNRGDRVEVLASFRSAEGLNIGTDVRMAGVSIGTVSDLALNPQTFRAETWLSLDTAVPVPDDSTAVVASDGIMGGAYVEIFPGGSLGNLGPGDEIVDTQGAVSLLQLLMQYVAGGGEE